MNPKINRYGDKEWYDSDGALHREDGPAIEFIGAAKFWFIHGKRHREDGPAIYYNGDYIYKEFWLDGNRYGEKEYWEKIKELNKCKLFKLKDKKIGWI